MNKRKLVQIIVKDLEEIKILVEEVAVNQNDAALVLDLALNKARLLYQEIELLRDSSDQEENVQEENDEDRINDDEDEASDIIISDPEFEIMNFEEREISEDDEGQDEPEDDEVTIDETEDDESDDEDDGISEDEDIIEDEENIEDESQNKIEEENPEEEEMEEGVMTGEDEEDTVEDEEIESDDDKDDIQPTPNSQDTELKTNPQPEVREIHINDLDDGDIETIQFSPRSDYSDRTVMHEIPKPENPVQEKLVVGETFQKERSLNDVIGEKKPAETILTNGPISNLRAAIGLNDRFLFIREIFDNNTDKYNTVIENLDKLETIQQAVEYLKANLSLQKNDTSLKFVELLKRRFSK
ncbi:MAG: hypothetical protein Q8N05_07165 [Bacteroidota bacterium]|nr:hypothetical protein [Bacteroidota bacterium]